LSGRQRIELIRKYKSNGESVASIADHYDLSRSLVYLILRLYKKQGNRSFLSQIPKELHQWSLKSACALVEEAVTVTNKNLTVAQIHGKVTTENPIDISKNETYKLIK
jgi:transposase-like protein